MLYNGSTLTFVIRRSQFEWPNGNDQEQFGE
jgi:hypothetical protein